jgi:hypothetical protein
MPSILTFPTRTLRILTLPPIPTRSNFNVEKFMRFVMTLLALTACSQAEAPVAHDTDKKEEVKAEAKVEAAAPAADAAAAAPVAADAAVAAPAAAPAAPAAAEPAQAH